MCQLYACGLDDLPALELLAAGETTTSLLQPARPVLHPLLAADTVLLHEKRALGTSDVIRMTIVLDRGVATRRCSPAVEAALRGSSSAWLGGLKNGPATCAADLLEDGFKAAWAWSSVTDLGTLVSAALQGPSADAKADVFRFHFIGGLLLSVLSLRGLSFHGLLLSGAAVLAALVAAAVELGLTNPHAHGLGDVALVTHGRARGSATSARDVRLLEARVARAGVACIEASVAARQDLIAGLLAMGDLISARLSWLVKKLVKRRLAARAVQNDVGRRRTVRRYLVLRVASLLALMEAAVVLPSTGRAAVERSVKPAVIGDVFGVGAGYLTMVE